MPGRKITSNTNLPQNLYRFLFIIFVLFFFLPMPITNLILQNENRIKNSELLLFTLIVYIILEVIEYRVFHYNATKKILIGMFWIRFLLWLIPLVLNINQEAFAPPFHSFLNPIIGYYAYFCFPKIISNIYCSFLILYGIWFNFSRSTGMPEDPHFLTSIFFLIVNIIIILFFQIFARLWERDKQTQMDNEKLLKDLKHSHSQLKKYATQVADIVALEERNRLARDIHDSLGHYLTALNIQLAQAQAYFHRNQKMSLEAVNNAKRVAEEAIEDVRESFHAISRKENYSFPEAIDKMLKRIDRNTYSIDYNFKGDASDFNYFVLIALYRVIQEGLTNIFKHSGADKIKLTVDMGDDEVKVCLKDNGTGFDTDTIHLQEKRDKSGFGLASLKERLELVRGQLIIKSAPGEGVELIAVAPKNPANII